MSALNEADFYYGAVLSTIFSKCVNPKVALIENGDEIRVYKFTTDNNEDVLFYIKYRGNCNATKKDDHKSWSFSLGDMKEGKLSEYLENKNFYLVLVCGMAKLRESEIAVLNTDDVKIFKDNKHSFTVTREKNQKAFRIKKDDGKELEIKTNRLLEIFK